jgi:hypothetical protein
MSLAPAHTSSSRTRVTLKDKPLGHPRGAGLPHIPRMWVTLKGRHPERVHGARGTRIPYLRVTVGLRRSASLLPIKAGGPCYPPAICARTLYVSVSLVPPLSLLRPRHCHRPSRTRDPGAARRRRAPDHCHDHHGSRRPAPEGRCPAHAHVSRRARAAGHAGQPLHPADGQGGAGLSRAAPCQPPAATSRPRSSIGAADPGLDQHRVKTAPFRSEAVKNNPLW